MPVLAYCIVESELEIDVPHVGVQDASIQSLTDSGLRCFISDYAASAAATGKPVQDAAVAFNAVLQRIFRQTAIVPFRFPTILQGTSELSGFLRQGASGYRDALLRLRNKVQMDLRISFLDHAEAAAEIPVGRSGTEYLQRQQARHQKLAAAARELRRAGGPSVERWSEREVPNGLRCYALVARSSIKEFLGQVENALLSPDLSARVTGPWPATEFLKED